MKITVLIENTAPEYLKCEHGLSIYIAYNESAICLTLVLPIFLWIMQKF